MNRGPVRAIWDKVQQLWRFIRAPEMPWSRKAMAAGSLLYLVSPLDAVPDVIPVGGLLDDVAVILFVVHVEATAEVEIRKHHRMAFDLARSRHLEKTLKIKRVHAA